MTWFGDGFFQIEEGPGPLIATAIHNGHEVRGELQPLLGLSDEVRLREEDPFTAEWTTVAPTRIVVQRSRFEVDLNRPRDQAIYRHPADAWGLRVWRQELTDETLQASLAEYDTFYAKLRELIERVIAREGVFLVLDLHSFNHKRAGPDAPPADPRLNPEVNLGTGSLDRERWGRVAEALVEGLSRFDFLGRQLDVRENVKFLGGNMTRWIHETFPGKGCSLAVEFKKFFMDEWTGTVSTAQHRAIGAALQALTPSLLEALRRVDAAPA